MDVPGGFGYGFIDCEETKLRFTRDVYVHRNQLEGLQIGDEVTFTLMLNSKGEPQARNVMKLEDALLLSSGQAMQTQDLHLMDENQALAARDRDALQWILWGSGRFGEIDFLLK
ncbi:unnamed protein product [Symbiodinium sp. CCMP2592]|nr:unnamed protein product [Symbiodinium sp. CCMP2592]